MTGVALVRSLRARARGTRAPRRGPGWPVDVWSAAGLLALLPRAGMWEAVPPVPVLLARAALAAFLAACAAGLAVWTTTTERRFTDRSPAASERRRFLTYGPYRHLRRPREAAIVLLVFATSLALPEWWRPLVALLVFAPSMAVRARRAERADAAEFGDEFERYRQTVPLFVPIARPRETAVTTRSR